MNNQPLQLPISFELALPLKIIFNAIWGGMFALAFYGWIVESVPIQYLFITLAIVAVNILWIRSVKLELTEAGVFFRSGTFSRQLDWQDIGGISYQLQHWGTGGELAAYVISRNPSKKHIKFNRFYFSSKNFAALVVTALSRGNQIELDPQIIRELSKKGVHFSTPPA